MRRGRRGRTVRALLATWAATTALLLPLAPAHAKAPESWARISITSIDPALPKRDGTVRLRGTVTNTSDQDLTNLQAIFWRSLDPIRDQEEMAQALESDADQPLGQRLVEVYENIPSENDRTLGPGERTRFDLTASIADLELPDEDAVYLIGVHVRGRTDPLDADKTLGRGRIFLPLAEDAPSTRSRVTSVVVLTSRPSLVRDDVLADDHLADELSSGGRLRLLLSAAAEAKTSFAVDPALIEEIDTMAGGYRVLAVNGTSTAPGSGQSAASAWLSDFTSVLRSGDGYQLPYGNPDIAALVHSNQRGLLELAADAADEVDATASLPLLVVPAGGAADAETMAAAAELGPRAIVVSDATTRGNGPLLEGPTGVPVVSYRVSASKGGPGPAPRNTPAKLQQRLLAQTYIEASTAPEGSTVGRVRLISGPAQAAGADADADVAAPWITRSTLAEVLQANPSDWNQRYRYPDSEAARQLSADQLAVIHRLSRDFTTASGLFVDPDEIDQAAQLLLPRSASSTWRGAEGAFRSYTMAVQRRLTSLLRDQVEIGVIPRVSTTGREGIFPVTVRNLIPADPADAEAGAVRLRLRFTSDNSQRLSVSAPDLPVIAAGQSVTVDARVKAQTNGTVRVVAQLETSSGAPVGRRVPIEVRATQAGTTGWVIAIAAGIVLLGTTALRIRQVARERSAATAPVEVSRPPEDQPEAGQHPREPLDV